MHMGPQGLEATRRARFLSRNSRDSCKTYDRPLAEHELTWFGDMGWGGVGRSYSALAVNCHLLTAETILSQPGVFSSWAKWPN